MDWVIEPFDQVFPVALDEVKVTEPPEQNVVAPLALIIEAVFTITDVGFDVALHVPLETETV
jgi:translation elongation factor EF-Tu-like GTPase